MSIANTNTFKFPPRWSQTNLASKQKLSFTKTHHVDVGTFQQVIIMSEVANVSWSLQLQSQIYKLKLLFWPYKMIDCHLTATIQVHETPPVQETGREFATRSGDIQAVVRFTTIITILQQHAIIPFIYFYIFLEVATSKIYCQVHHHQLIIISTILQQHTTYPGVKTKT